MTYDLTTDITSDDYRDLEISNQQLCAEIIRLKIKSRDDNQRLLRFYTGWLWANDHLPYDVNGHKLVREFTNAY